MLKKELRKQLLQARDCLPEATREQAGNQIYKKVLEMLSFVNCEAVLCYVSFRSEVDTRDILEACFRSDKKVFCPKVLGPHKMEFYRVQNWNDLEPGTYGILEPKNCLTDYMYHNQDAEKTCMLVPGAGFDYNGYRIGYGGGFYDSYLSSHHVGCTIGLCYESQRIPSIEPEPGDQKVDCVITEKEVYTIV